MLKSPIKSNFDANWLLALRDTPTRSPLYPRPLISGGRQCWHRAARATWVGLLYFWLDRDALRLGSQGPTPHRLPLKYRPCSLRPVSGLVSWPVSAPTDRQCSAWCSNYRLEDREPSSVSLGSRGASGSSPGTGGVQGLHQGRGSDV